MPLLRKRALRRRVRTKKAGQEVLDHFLGAHRPVATVGAYRADLSRFALFNGSSIPKAVISLCSSGGHQLAQRWLDSLIGHESYETRRRRASTLRSLFDLGARLGLGTGRLQVDVPKGTINDMRGPSVEVVQRMLTACGEEKEGVRNRALVFLMASLGLRRAEAARLHVSDYDQEKCRLRVHGKGGRVDWVNIPKEGALLLEEWLKLDEPKVAIFHAPGRVEALSLQGVDHIFRQLSVATGVKVRPGGLRHFAITTALEKGFSWKTVMGFARHKNADSTEHYDDRPQLSAEEAAAQVATTVAEKLLGPEKAG